jgi:hypothetical protein
MATPQQLCANLHALTDTISGGYLWIVRTFPDAAGVSAAARAVQMANEAPVPPDYAPLCAAARDWQSSDGQEKLLNGIAVWGRDKGFDRYALGPVVGFALWRVLTNPRAHNPSDPMATVAYAATTVVTLAKDGSVDAVSYAPLWQLVLSDASVRVRVGAMKGLQAILRRGVYKLLPGEVAKAEALAQQARQRGATVPPSQRNEYMIDADALLGAVGTVKTRLELIAAGYAPAAVATQAPFPPGPSDWPNPKVWPWWSWAAIAAGGLTVVGGAAALALRSRGPAAA